MSKFYCRKVCGDPSFSIEEWNRLNTYCNTHNITGYDRDWETPGS